MKIDQNKKKIILIGILVLIVIVCIVLMIFKIGFKNYTYKSNIYSFKYNNTWKLNKKKDDVVLVHKKSKGKITITYKILDSYLIDVKLKDIISDLIFDIEKQNKNYKLINKNYDVETGYYKLLYEKDDEQCLINIIKKDRVLLFIYYNTNSKYFDITIDNLDNILSSLEIYSGEDLNE